MDYLLKQVSWNSSWLNALAKPTAIWVIERVSYWNCGLSLTVRQLQYWARWDGRLTECECYITVIIVKLFRTWRTCSLLQTGPDDTWNIPKGLFQLHMIYKFSMQFLQKPFGTLLKEWHFYLLYAQHVLWILPIFTYVLYLHTNS